MIIVLTSPQVCDREKMALPFLSKEAFIEAMEKMAECQEGDRQIVDTDDAIAYFEEALQMFNTSIITEKAYRARQGEFHETVERAAYGLGWQE